MSFVQRVSYNTQINKDQKLSFAQKLRDTPYYSDSWAQKATDN